MLLSAGLEDKVPVRAAEEPRFLSSSVLWLKPESLGRLLSSSRSTQLFCQLLSEVLLLWRLSMREHRAALQIQSLKHHHLRYPGFRENLPTNFSDTTYRYSLRSRERKKDKKVERMLGRELQMWGTEYLLLCTPNILQHHKEYEDAAYTHCLDSAGCSVLNFPGDQAASW